MQQKVFEEFTNTYDIGANKQLLNIQLIEADKQITHAIELIANEKDAESLKAMIQKIDQIRLKNIQC